MRQQLTWFLPLVGVARGQNNQVFNYGFQNINNDPNGGQSFAQQNWEDVGCSSIETCLGWPNKFLDGIGFTIAGQNNCQWCPQQGPQNCGLHRQSPIDLKRDRSIPGHVNEKECPDWHWMQYRDDTCSWADMQNQFSIERHALKLQIPTASDGEIDCEDDTGRRQFPRLDYSKGFPDWWWLDHTQIQLPSQHTQEGKHYDAEVTLAHFYQIEHPKNQLGHVTMFMDAYDDVEPWPFLDKLICQWRRVEENVRASCGLDPAPPYGRCALFRGQEPTEEWLREAGLAEDPTEVPVSSPTTRPTRRPTPQPTREPTNPPASVIPTEIPTRKPTRSPQAVEWTLPPILFRPQTTPSPVSSAQSPTTDRPTWPEVLQPTLAPHTKLPTPAPTSSAGVVSPVATPVATPVAAPVTATPVAAVVTALPTLSGVPPEIDCSLFGRYDRMCDSVDPCCEAVRGDSEFCWRTYELTFPGDAIYSACYHCCSTPRLVGPPNPPLPAVPKTIFCSNVPNPHRICKPNSCCTSPRSGTLYCRILYDQFPGDLMEQICHYCCSSPQIVGPPGRRLRNPGSNFTLPGFLVDPGLSSNQSSAVDAPTALEIPPKPIAVPTAQRRPRVRPSSASRLNADSEMPEKPKASATQGELLRTQSTASAVHVGESTKKLDAAESASDEPVAASGANRSATDGRSRNETSVDYPPLPKGAKVTYLSGQRRVLREENFEEDEEDEHQYFERIYSDYKRRNLQAGVHEEDYADVDYWPYEWMLKVGTEYYFRYEGTQVVPPCWEAVHWRVMKDPIRVPQRQIDELDRLLAWRIKDTQPNMCQRDTAGVRVDANKVRVNREVQYYHTQHRKVFCECKDWPSKFEGDKEWCKNHKTDDNHDRFYEYPYSFESNGNW